MSSKNAINLERLIIEIGGVAPWSKQCHACSLAMIRTGILPHGSRVARGRHKQLMSQHSWVVIGDPYHPETIIDGTIWSYLNEKPHVKLIQKRSAMNDYIPKGSGSIWESGRPDEPIGKIIQLRAKLSPHTKAFLEMAAPKGLDFKGWSQLANSPVSGWPSKEILTAIYKDRRLMGLVPIDVIGMLTDINPGRLYF